MAIDDISFYNLIGEEITRTGIVEQMINYYMLKLEAGETRVTDFNEGSEIRNLLEAFAVDLYMLLEEQNELTSIGFIDSADGEWLDKHGANPFIKLPRDTGSESVGFVTFSIPEAEATDTTISEGTIVVSDDGLQYVTDADCTIFAGDTSNEVSITCLTTGLDGNVNAGEINTIDDEDFTLTNVTVVNTDATVNGTDYEEDEEYRERLLAYIRQDDFGSVDYYTRLCEEVDGVHDVILVTGTSGYTRNVLVNGDVKPASSSICSDVLEVLSLPENIVVGHSFQALPCSLTNVNLTLNLTMQEEIEDNVILSLLNCYFNGGGYDRFEYEGLYIDESINREKLLDVLYGLPEILEAEIIDPSTSESIGEITPTANTALKLNTVNINQTTGD